MPAEHIAALRPTAVNAILAEVAQLPSESPRPVSLMRGEPDLPTPPHIVEAAARSLHDGRTGYPNNKGEPALAEAVSDKIAETQGVKYDPSREILITTGATLGIQVALAATLDRGDEVIIPSPIYDAYHSAIALAGGVVRTVPAAIVNRRYTIDPGAIAQCIGPRSRAILLNTPWNPTGTVLERGLLAQIIELAERHNLVVISDEIYEAIVYNNKQHISPAATSDRARTRTVVVNSFSKTYCMTGWRLGYCAAPEDLTKAMYLVLQQSSRGPATFVQDAGVVALRSAQDCVRDIRREFARRLQLVHDTLADVNATDVLTPDGGFFAMLDVSRLNRSSDEIRRYLLHEFGVVVVHGAAYGPAGEGTLRVSFAKGGENLEQGLLRLREGLGRLASSG